MMTTQAYFYRCQYSICGRLDNTNLLVDESLNNVADERQSEQDREKDGCAKGRNIEKDGITGFWRQVAVFPWLWMCTGLGGRYR